MLTLFGMLLAPSTRGAHMLKPAKFARFIARSVSSTATPTSMETLEGEPLPPERPAVFDKSSPGASHPCVSCGACCAFYRASFPFFEVQQRQIPEDLVQEINFPYVAMRGTHLKATADMRCVALKGTVGEFGTLCGIYENRASCCRDFWPSLEDGVTHNARCDKAREAHNMVPLVEADWERYRQEATQK